MKTPNFRQIDFPSRPIGRPSKRSPSLSSSTIFATKSGPITGCTSSNYSPNNSKQPHSARARRAATGVPTPTNSHSALTPRPPISPNPRASCPPPTINNSYDFGVGKRLHNLPKLRDIGFAANRRLLEVERLSFDCILAEDTFRHINGPVEQAGQRASGLRFADPRIHPLWHALILFRLLPTGFRRANSAQASPPSSPHTPPYQPRSPGPSHTSKRTSPPPSPNSP
jgi:hypothetical protein